MLMSSLCVDCMMPAGDRQKNKRNYKERKECLMHVSKNTNPISYLVS